MTIPDTPPDDRTILSTRVLAASQVEVFDAFADPQRLARWWGPDGIRNTIDTFEFYPCGTWRLVMHAPDGTDYPNLSTFLAIVRPRRIVFDHIEPHYFRMTLSFDPAGSGTRFTMAMRFDTDEHFSRVRDFVVVANEQNIDRLAAELERTA